MTQTHILQASGALDPSFGQAGILTLPFPGVVGGIPAALLAQPQNKLLIAISTAHSENSPAKVARVNEDGALDPTFADNGIAQIPFNQGQHFVPFHFRPLANGGWLIVGTVDQDGRVDLAVVRQHSNGSLDTSFGEGGRVIINAYDLIGPVAGEGASFLSRLPNRADSAKRSNSSANIVSTMVQPDDKILLVSHVFTPSEDIRGIVLRLGSDGTLDQTFNQKGFVLVELPEIDHGWSRALGVVVQQDGKVLVCGEYGPSHTEWQPRAYVIRYDQSGNVDTRYGESNNGVVSIADSRGWLNFVSMALRADGGIVATGSLTGTPKSEGLIVVLTPNGSFNRIFNNGMPLFSDFLKDGISWERCSVQADGKVVICGQGGLAYLEENSSIVTARYLSDGVLDRTFADGGWAVFNDTSGLDIFKGAAVMADNRIAVCGFLYSLSEPLQGRVIRYLG